MILQRDKTCFDLAKKTETRRIMTEALDALKAAVTANLFFHSVLLTMPRDQYQ